MLVTPTQPDKIFPLASKTHSLFIGPSRVSVMLLTGKVPSFEFISTLSVNSRISPDSMIVLSEFILRTKAFAGPDIKIIRIIEKTIAPAVSLLVYPFFNCKLVLFKPILLLISRDNPYLNVTIIKLQLIVRFKYEF